MLPVIYCAAHLPEIRTLIDCYKLKRSTQKPVIVYTNVDRSVFVVITGTGQLRSTLGLAYVCTKYELSHPVCINVGIAGHATASIGECLAISKIHDKATNQSAYPEFGIKLYNYCSLQSVPRVETTYSEADTLFDMEGYGFYTSAMNFTAHHLIRLFKVVSDNREHSVKNVSKEMVEQLMSSHLMAIKEDAEHIASSNQVSSFSNHLEAMGSLKKHIKMSEYQRHQIYELLRRMYVLKLEEKILPIVRDLTQANDAIKVLKAELISDPAVYDWSACDV